MAHLNDKLAEFFYGELPPAELGEARRHLETCTECRLQVQRFEKIHLALRSAPALDPPRRIVFSLPEQRSWFAWFDWRSAAVAAAAAALIVILAIRFLPAPAPLSISMPGPAAVVLQPEKIDYNRIVNEVQQADRSWLAGEMKKRDQEIQRLQAELAYYETFQRTVMRETLENGSAIQLLAQHTASRD
jgi:anti-sigma factor RsiW